MQSESEIRQENIEVCEEFSDLIKKNLVDEIIINSEKLDELYVKIKKIIKHKNNKIKEWYDEQYHNNVFDMNINMNKFISILKKDEDNVFRITY
jgi:hypothetical protein